MIRVDSVTRTYGAITAVDDISFAVAAGEIVGFVGPNGAGKSTMLKMLATFLRPTAGTVTVGGFDTLQAPLEVRRRIGYLPGDTPLYRDMVVDDLVRFVGGAHGLVGADLEAARTRVIDICDIGPVLGQRVRECSTGFRQRVGLSCALVHDPPVLLLDEPTHGFDPLQVMAFRDLLIGLKQDRAILFSTHIIADVEAISDRVLIIHQGRILGDGNLDELEQCAGLGGAGLEAIFAHLVSTTTTTQVSQ
ncbi:MAG TPA: multidrug ABC transporter ATP-binding protein [Candidatus Latescibacteria bacterium]|nr:multidrug ABC transporter ATP-binding protein [Candidatus Latescibacterota bacterium]